MIKSEGQTLICDLCIADVIGSCDFITPWLLTNKAYTKVKFVHLHIQLIKPILNSLFHFSSGASHFVSTATTAFTFTLVKKVQFCTCTKNCRRSARSANKH